MRRLTTLLILLAASMAVFGQSAKPGSAVVSFASGRSSLNIPFQIANNLVLVEASVNGSATGWFIFDTGAGSTVVDTEFAKSLGLKQTGTTTGNGAAGSATAGVIKGGTVQVSGLTAKNLTVYTLPLGSFTPGFGTKISGIIGNDIIGKVVADINYADRALSLYEPGAFVPVTDAVAVPITIEDDLPFAQTEITARGRQPVKAKMELDTGSTGAILLNSPFVRAKALLPTLSNSMRSKTGGVGGTGNSIVGRMASFRFGQWTLPEPIAVLYTGTRGDNASRVYDGLIGGGIFRRFRVAIDMPGRTVYLRPNETLNDPFDADMSGLELLADGPDLKKILVDEVTPGSAGARAGLRGGDMLEAVDGKPVSELGYQEVRRLFRKDGARYELTVRRGSQKLQLPLLLKRVI